MEARRLASSLALAAALILSALPVWAATPAPELGATLTPSKISLTPSDRRTEARMTSRANVPVLITANLTIAGSDIIPPGYRVKLTPASGSIRPGQTVRAKITRKKGMEPLDVRLALRMTPAELPPGTDSAGLVFAIPITTDEAAADTATTVAVFGVLAAAIAVAIAALRKAFTRTPRAAA